MEAARRRGVFMRALEFWIGGTRQSTYGGRRKVLNPSQIRPDYLLFSDDVLYESVTPLLALQLRGRGQSVNLARQASAHYRKPFLRKKAS